jgi:hypothetical protein
VAINELAVIPGDQPCQIIDGSRFLAKPRA